MKNCPWCAGDLNSLPAIEVIEHLYNHLEQLKMSGDGVVDEDQLELGCENLAPRKEKPHRVYPAGEPGWKRGDFSRNLGNEEVE